MTLEGAVGSYRVMMGAADDAARALADGRAGEADAHLSAALDARRALNIEGEPIAADVRRGLYRLRRRIVAALRADAGEHFGPPDGDQ